MQLGYRRLIISLANNHVKARRPELCIKLVLVYAIIMIIICYLVEKTSEVSSRYQSNSIILQTFILHTLSSKTSSSHWLLYIVTQVLLFNLYISRWKNFLQSSNKWSKFFIQLNASERPLSICYISGVCRTTKW